jgi:hypothetical protein
MPVLFTLCYVCVFHGGRYTYLFLNLTSNFFLAHICPRDKITAITQYSHLASRNNTELREGEEVENNRTEKWKVVSKEFA